MDARRMGAEAITTRIGAIALPLGIILLVVASAFHPSREDAMDNPAVFTEYAQSDSWVAVHLAQWGALLLVFGGSGSLYYSITTKSDLGAAVARFGLAAVVLTAATFTMLQAVDGVALKWAVGAWASAPADQEAAAFAAAEALRYTEYAIQSLFTILLGLTLILYGLAIALGTVYPRWLGWVAVGSGVAWIAHGVRVPYIGLSDSIGEAVGAVLLYLVGVHHGVCDVAQQQPWAHRSPRVGFHGAGKATRQRTLSPSVCVSGAGALSSCDPSFYLYSPNSPSRACLEIRMGLQTGALRAAKLKAKRALVEVVRHPQTSLVKLSLAIFQTVSLETVLQSPDGPEKSFPKASEWGSSP